MEAEEPAASAIDKPRVQTAARTCELLLVVANSGVQGATAKILSEKLGVPRQVVYHLIHTLVSIGMLRKATGNAYVLGLSAAPIAHAFRQQLSSRDYLRDYAIEASQVTGETAYVGGWLDGEICVFASNRGSATIAAAAMPEGKIGDGHARASGKLLLAMSGAREVDEYLARHPIRPLTQNTIDTRPALDLALSDIRREFVSFDREEYTPGLSCVAVPLGPVPTQLVLSISAPTERFRERFEAYARQLRSIASDVPTMQHALTGRQASL
jgi:DNA-binding IclR family transcriptional regulator